MVLCILCSSDKHDCQCYQCGDMGPEIISTIENALGHEVDEGDTMCEDCFGNIMQTISAAPGGISVQDEYKLQHLHDLNVCVWCQSSLYRRRTHHLPESERQFIAEMISPRNVSAGSLVCYRCWLRVRRTLQQQDVEMPPESSATSAINANTCVWCLCSLACTRRQSLPEGPERDLIISRIFPREIPPQGRVCYSCWVAARRIVQRAQMIDEVGENAVSAHRHHNVSCALCGMSLFRRQTHTVPSGPERDELTARISPRELSGNLLCTHCWSLNVRRIEQVDDMDNVHNRPTPTMSTMDLDEFTHTTNSSHHCFVPSCSNTERLLVPIFLRKRILSTQKIFVTENARVCNAHKSLDNWEFLDHHEFSNTFTKKEMQSMLKLSVKESNDPLE